MICTYAHYKPDNTIFYIGIGNAKRPYDFQKRSNYWKNIVAKYGKPNVQILAEWDTAEEAKQHEIVLIDCFKSMGYQLANLTNGGDGCNGYRHTEEHKQKMSDRFKGDKNPMFGMVGNKNPNYGNGLKIARGNHPLAIKVKYNNQIFDCIKDLADYLNKPYKTLYNQIYRNAAKYGYEVLK